VPTHVCPIYNEVVFPVAPGLHSSNRVAKKSQDSGTAREALENERRALWARASEVVDRSRNLRQAIALRRVLRDRSTRPAR
jgi:hypothetical protein